METIEIVSISGRSVVSSSRNPHMRFKSFDVSCLRAVLITSRNVLRVNMRRESVHVQCYLRKTCALGKENCHTMQKSNRLTGKSIRHQTILFANLSGLKSSMFQALLEMTIWCVILWNDIDCEGEDKRRCVNASSNRFIGGSIVAEDDERQLIRWWWVWRGHHEI